MGGDISGPDLDTLKAAYESVNLGADGPTEMVCQGAVLLHFRPDLAGTIDPGRTYRIVRRAPKHLSIEEVR